MSSFSPAKIGFVFSLAVLAFLGGFATRAVKAPPNDTIERAWLQARALFEPPTFLKSRVYDRSGARTVDPEKVQPGITLVTSMWNHESAGWQPGIRLIGQEGDVLHEWHIDGEALFPDSLNLDRQQYLHGSHLLPNGDVLFNIEHGGTVRADACGRVQWRLPVGTHHSIDRAADGSFWISDVSAEPSTTSEQFPDGYPGLDTPVFQDQLTHVSPDGRVLDRINLLDVLYNNGLDRYISRAFISADVESPSAEVPGVDPLHLNDVEPLPPAMADEYPLFEAGDLVVSLRNVHLVFVLDPASRTVKWHASDPFIMQHDPDFLGDGWIGVFDNNRDFTNRGTMLGGSRIIALQPHTDSTRVLFPTARSEPFYTEAGGKWQQLANGNMLLTENHASRVVEVTPEGETVWEWIRAPYNDTSVPSVQEGTRYDLTPKDIQAWPCAAQDAVRVPQEE